MHYCLMLFTENFPQKDDIENIMQKYCYDNLSENDHPQFTYDWCQIGGRYNGDIKLKFDWEDEEYRWKYCERTPRNGRLFWSYLLNKIQSGKNRFFHEEDYFNSMGARDGFLYVDGAKISDILNFDELDCYTFIGIDGEAYSRKWWDGHGLVSNNDFDERLKSEKEKAKDGYVTIIDYHD